MTMNHTEQLLAALRLESTRFECRLDYWLTWLKTFLIFLRISRWITRKYLELEQETLITSNSW